MAAHRDRVGTATWVAALAASAGAWAVLAAAHPAAVAQTSPTAPGPLTTLGDLTPGPPREQDLAASARHAYRLTLTAGDVVVVTIEQRGADIAASLTPPPGSSVLTLDAMDDEYRPERLVAVVDTGGTYTLQVSSTRPTAAGRYAIRVDAIRPATAADRHLVEAERAFAEARRLRNPSQAATWPEALRIFQTALDGFTGLDDRAGVMKTTLEIGITENYLSKPEALTRAREAARLAREAGEPAAVARALRLVGNILVANGDYPNACEALDAAAAAAASIGAQNSEARGLNDAAIAYRRRGDLEHAVELYERALVLARATADGNMEGNITNNLGVAYKTLGDLDRAFDLFQQALAHRRAAGDTRAQYHLLINLSNVLRGRGDYARAEAHATEALAISRTIGDGVREAGALSALGQAEHAAGRGEEAVAHHRAALALARSLPNRDEESLALTNLSRTLRGLGRLDEALGVIQDALALSRRAQWPFAIRDDLTELALVHRDRGDLAAAARELDEALTIDETSRSGITSPELRASFVASEYDRYELYLEVLHRLHQADGRAGFDARALEVSERSRARVLLDGLLDGGVDLREGVTPELLAEEARLQKALNAASVRLSESLAEAKAGSTDALQAQVQRLTADLTRVRADVRRQSPAYADVMQPQPLSADRIQRDVLDPDTVLLEFALGEAQSWLWAVTPQTISLHALPGRAAIDQAARRWYEQVVARQPHDGETDAAHRLRVAAADRRRGAEGQALSDLLLGPVASRIESEWRGRRLAVVAAGVLDILPFNALPSPRAGSTVTTTGSPLLSAGHEIVRVPSASVLAALRRDRRVTAPAKTLAVLADPVFERADPRVARADRPDATSPAPAPTPAATLISRNALGRAPLARLPFSREEADGIASLVPASQLMKATGFDATRDTAIDRALRDYRIVHFATHGVFDSARPALSGLIFSLVDRRGGYRNGYVRLHDIYNLRLNADLVVLSACETALGTEIKGEGLVGLARAFMYAGAPSVVASLWSVNDLATAELMTRFYRHMLQRSLRPAAALHAAQREMRESAQWRDPYYWAGFTLVGDWR